MDLSTLLRQARVAGWPAVIASRVLPRMARTSSVVRLSPNGFSQPVQIRPGTSDGMVFRQVFLEQQYKDCLALENVSTIVDVGANVGLASSYFLQHYTQASVIVVEPDADNAAACARNLEAFGSRTQILQTAVWTEAGPLKVARNEFGDGREWSFSVRPVRTGEKADVTAVTMFQLIEMSGGHIDLLKMDIEGAEEPLLEHPNRDWLDHVGNFAIELHSRKGETLFRTALEPYEGEWLVRGETTLVRGLRRKRV